MFHKPDDVKEFDERVKAIRSLLPSDEIVRSVTSLMQSVTWHDWTPDCPYPPGMVDNLTPGDATLVRHFVESCVLFLGRPGDAGIQRLRKQADAYLTDRGTNDSVDPIDTDQYEWHSDYFTVAELTRMRKAVKLSASPSSMTRHIEREIADGRIQRDGSKAMRLRMDLYSEWNAQSR